MVRTRRPSGAPDVLVKVTQASATPGGRWTVTDPGATSTVVGTSFTAASGRLARPRRARSEHAALRQPAGARKVRLADVPAASMAIAVSRITQPSGA